ncbi:MAG: hypothetical protein QM757_13770 [Paludibaculum sp.]
MPFFNENHHLDSRSLQAEAAEVRGLLVNHLLGAEGCQPGEKVVDGIAIRVEGLRSSDCPDIGGAPLERGGLPFAAFDVDAGDVSFIEGQDLGRRVGRRFGGILLLLFVGPVDSSAQDRQQDDGYE